MEQTIPAATYRPRLRRDLEFTHRRTGEIDEIIVCDPINGSYFRAGELEAALFAQLDGEKDQEEIASRLGVQYPDLPPGEVSAFIDNLAELGILEGTRVHKWRPPLWRRLIYAQVRVANPDRLFARMGPYVGWMYRPVGIAIICMLYLAAAITASGSYEDIMRAISGTYGPGFIIWLWLGFVLIGTIHEFGHGLTCRSFGGRTTGIGLFFIYGLPCFYCDVSGAWMLPKKSQRLWVGAAGLYYQFIAGSIALLLWRAVEPGTLLSTVLLVMVTSCGLLSLFNLNPLLKLDGYYLLSDALEIPNLRRRGFGELWRRLGGFWFGGSRGAGGGLPEEESDRVRRICLAYGFLAALFLVWLLPRLVLGGGRFLTGRFGGFGAFLLITILTLQFGIPVSRVGAGFWRRLAGWKEIPMLRRRRLLLAGGALAVVLPSTAAVPSSLKLTIPCKLEAARHAAVRARTDGRIAELLVREGDQIRAGQVLGHLATFEREQQRLDRQAQLSRVRMEIAALQDRLPMINANTAKAGAEATLDAQEARTRLTEERETLPGRVAEMQGKANAAHADVITARARLSEAQASVDAQERISTRLRRDVDRPAEDAPPSLAAARERWKQLVNEQELAGRDLKRIQTLVADGAMTQQQLDHAKNRDETTSRRVTESLHEIAALEKRLREDAEDADAELTRRRAGLEAARAAEAAAVATETAAGESLRQVQATSGPARLETARLRAESGAIALAAARTGSNELLARRAEIRAKQQEALQLEAQISILTDQIRRSALRAPCDGVITTHGVEQKMGGYFKEGATVVDVEDPRTLSIRIFVNEKEIGDIHVDQPVTLYASAFPSKMYYGQVSEIAPRAVRGGTAAFPVNTVEVRLQVKNPTGELRPSMSGWAKIDCGRQSLGAILFRRITRHVRSEVWSWF